MTDHIDQVRDAIPSRIKAAMTTKEKPAHDASRDTGLSDAIDERQYRTDHTRCRQVFAAWGDARRRLERWIGSATVHVQVLHQGDDYLALGGVGPWFAALRDDDVVAYCQPTARVGDEDAPLNALVEFLRNEDPPDMRAEFFLRLGGTLL